MCGDQDCEVVRYMFEERFQRRDSRGTRFTSRNLEQGNGFVSDLKAASIMQISEIH